MDVERVGTGRRRTVTALTSRPRLLVMLVVAPPAIQVRGSPVRALLVTLDTLPSPVHVVGKVDLARHRRLGDGEPQHTLRMKDDASQLLRLVAVRARPIHPFGHVMAAPAVRDVANDQGTVLRGHRVAVETLEVLVQIVPEARVGHLSHLPEGDRAERGDARGAHGQGPNARQEH